MFNEYLIQKSTLDEIAVQSNELIGKGVAVSPAEIIADLTEVNAKIEEQSDLIYQVKSAIENLPNIEDVQSPPVIYIDNDGTITATVNGVSSTYYLQTTEGQRITPGNTDVNIVPPHTYVTGNITVQGDKDLLPQNIIAGINIFGVTGSAPYCKIENDTIIIYGDIAEGTYKVKNMNDSGKQISNDAKLIVGYNVQNQLLTATATIGDSSNVYNGIGYMHGRRWSNSGGSETTSSNPSVITGYIGCNPGDTVYIKNVVIWKQVSTYTYLVKFSESFTYLGTNSIHDLTPDVNGVYSIVIPNDTYYFRLVNGEYNENTIITINQYPW